MKIGLVSEIFRNNDIGFNCRQIDKRLAEAKERNIDLVCFGESFLQGFDGLTWQHKEDLQRACSQEGETIQSIKELAVRHDTALSFGYIERVEDLIYSSNLVISSQGQILNNYRRVSVGWKVPRANPQYYKEGLSFGTFSFKGKQFATAICGDLWYDDNIEAIKKLQADCILWPIYVDYPVAKWEGGEKKEYARQVASLGVPVLMINSFVEAADRAKGGCCIFRSGKILKELPMGELGLLEFDYEDKRR